MFIPRIQKCFNIEKKSQGNLLLMMVNFPHQFDWTTRFLDVRWDIAVGLSVRVFLGEINIWIYRMSKADCLPYIGWVSSNKLKAHIEQKGWAEENSSCQTDFELGHWLLLSLKPAGLWSKTTSQSLLGLQLADSLWRF